MTKSLENSPEDILSILNENPEYSNQIEDKIKEHYRKHKKPDGGLALAHSDLIESIDLTSLFSKKSDG